MLEVTLNHVSKMALERGETRLADIGGIRWYITTEKHSKAHPLCIILGICCMCFPDYTK